MTQHYSIFGQAQADVCTALNEDDVLSGKVLFIPENSKDIDYEIKNAIGSQGIVGIVMTPEATYQGVTSVGEQVWDLRDFTVQIVENPIVNRGQPKYANITALDAATRAAQVLADPRFGLFGQYCPTTIEQGEDNGLIVAQTKFNVQIKAKHKDLSKTYVTYQDGTTAEYDIVGNLTSSSIPNISDAEVVEIGSYVTSIGNYAFYGCSRLTSVTIPNSITSIGDYAFSGCLVLTSLKIPDSVTSIGDYAFGGCASLTSVAIPDDVTSIGDYAFESCESLTSITIGNGVTSIGRWAFSNCISLTNVTFSGKTKAQVQGMANYSWYLKSGCIIHCTDGDIII